MGVQSLVPAKGPDPLPVRQQYSQLRTTGLETGVVKRERKTKAPKVKAGLGLHLSTKHQATKKKKGHPTSGQTSGQWKTPAQHGERRDEGNVDPVFQQKSGLIAVCRLVN